MATVLAAVSLVMMATAFAASLIPARRAPMVDPTIALRVE
jgi:ABC-type lipoprotein release transport system permease subunit